MGGKFPNHTAFCHTPEFPVMLLYREYHGAHLSVDLIVYIIPVHDAAFRFLRHPVADEGLEDLAFVITETAALQFCAVVLDVTPFVPLIEVCGEGHIQLHDGGFRRQDSEAVLSHDQSQTTAIVPLHMKLPDIIDAFQRTRGTGRHRVIGIFHLSELDSAPCRVLLPQKSQPFFRNGQFTYLPSAFPGRAHPAPVSHGFFPQQWQ